MKISLEIVIGTLTVICSYGIKFIGFPEQIQKIKKAQSVTGISKSLFVFSFISYLLWTAYGIIKKDWVVIAGQSVGVIVGGIVLIQIWTYRKNK